MSFVGWYGANGYTVIIDLDNGAKCIYGHISPKFKVSRGDKVYKGQEVASVGPKYIEAQSYTIYTDSNGKTTNGATTGPHLHFAISVGGIKIDPRALYN